ncbi:hypothetical protein BLOT_007991 [Blomia tropicalis]|nr:hypothetical protein BLOT_007991 [Blomia tropicalis]
MYLKKNASIDVDGWRRMTDCSTTDAQSTPVTPGLSNQKYMRAKWIKNGGAEKVQSSPIGIHGFGGAVFD